MVRIYFLTTFILLVLCKISASFDINCKFAHTNGYAVIGRVYICVSSNIHMLTPESAQISGIHGTHEALKSNDVVDGFHANRQVMNYFPQGLDRFFPSLQSIAIWRCGMKEIYQNDLKPFPGLRSLNMYNNHLQVLEQGLLDFNPNLEVVGFQGNRLVHIDPNLFDNLNKMTNLNLEGVPCVDKNTKTREETTNCIETIKEKCSDVEFVEMDNQVKNLINESEILRPEDFNNELDKMEKVVADYEFSKFRPLSNDIENLKSLKMDIPATEPKEESTTISDFELLNGNDNSDLDMNLRNISQELNDFVAKPVANVTDLKDMKNAADESVKEPEAPQVDANTPEESNDARITALETQVKDKFEALEKKLDSILKALNILK